VLTVHDAIACVVPIDEADEARNYIEQCMRTPPKWAVGLPLNCESGMAQNYGDC
jgi:DNA polymerase I-like protein with 3'-5' exonuclease and polymerase domains